MLFGLSWGRQYVIHSDYLIKGVVTLNNTSPNKTDLLHLLPVRHRWVAFAPFASLWGSNAVCGIEARGLFDFHLYLYRGEGGS